MKTNRFNYSDGRGFIFWCSLIIVVFSFAFPVAKTSSAVIEQFGMGYDPCRIFSEEIESGIVMAVSAGLMLLISFINCLATPEETVPKTWIRIAFALSGAAYFWGTISMFDTQYSPYVVTFPIHLCRILTLLSLMTILFFKAYLQAGAPSSSTLKTKEQQKSENPQE